MDTRGQSLNSRISDTISNLSDEDLLDMLKRSPKEYTLFALSVAREELAKRGGESVIRERIAVRTAREAPVHVELPKRTKDILIAVPKARSGWEYSLYEGEQLVAHMNGDTSWWGEAGEISIAESVYRAYRVLNGETADDLVLEYQDVVLARAQDSAFSRSFKIEYGGKHYTLQPAGVSARIFHLFNKQRLIGTIAEEDGQTRIRLPIAVPLPVSAFTFWLVVLVWKRATE